VGLDIVLEFSSTFVINSLRLIVHSAVIENSSDIFAKMFPVFILIVRKFLLDSFKINRIFYNQSIIWYVFNRDGLSERPNRRMFFQQFNNALALQSKGYFFSFNQFVMIFKRPSTLLYTRNL